jgi:uncharacterized protein (TIGR02996 family)
MSHEDAFLRAIAESPDDDAPRLIYADWLDERGDPRGEFIRVQCELARMPPGDPPGHVTRADAYGFQCELTLMTPDEPRSPDALRRQELQAREQALLTAHAATWLGPLFSLIRTGEITRGFIAKFPLFLGRPGLGGEDLIQGMLACPLLLSIPELNLERNRVGSNAVRALAASWKVQRLEALWLGGNPVGVEGARALAASPHLRHLSRLDLSTNGLGNDGAQALAGATEMPSLEVLNLRKNRISAAGAEALAECPHWPRLMVLNLGNNPIGNRGAMALAGSRYLTGLRTLHLRGTGMGWQASEALRARFGDAMVP